MSDTSTSYFDRDKYYKELMNLILVSEYFDDETMKKKQQKLFDVKKYILLSKYYEEVQNIKDEYVLDGFIESNKDDLNWDDFLVPIRLDYKIKWIRKEVIKKLKLYGSITYSQLFQMKIYYEREFEKVIEDYLDSDEEYLKSPAFFYHFYIEKVETGSDIKKAIELYKTSNIAIIYAYLIDFFKLPKEECREYLLR